MGRCLRLGLICGLFMTGPAVAVELEVGGFIAVDLLQVTKADNARQDTHMGIGSLDLKVNGRQDNTSVRLKLDLDDSRPGDAYKLFEMALLTQDITSNFRLSAGKGVVRFHRMHWAGISPSYFDGGTILGNHDWTFVDQDNKLLIALEYGGRRTGSTHTLTLYGDDTMEVLTNRDGSIRRDEAGKPMMAGTSKTFDPKRQRGAAYRWEGFFGKGFVISAAALQYWHDFNPHLNQAVDIGMQWNTPSIEVWAEVLQGHSSSFLYDYENRDETLIQIGAEYFLAPTFSVIGDIEGAWFTYDEQSNGALRKVDGSIQKAEWAGRYAFNKFTYLVNGVMWETRQDQGQERIDALRFNSALSHWF